MTHERYLIEAGTSAMSGNKGLFGGRSTYGRRKLAHPVSRRHKPGLNLFSRMEYQSK